MNEDINLFINNYMGDLNNDIDIQNVKEDRKYSPFDKNLCDVLQNESPGNYSNKKNVFNNTKSGKNVITRKKEKKVKLPIKSQTQTNNEQINTNDNSARASINQFIYNNISSMFNIQNSPPKTSDELLANLLPLYIAQVKDKCDDILISQLIHKVFSDDSYALNTIRTFCEFLNKNGYTIKKKEIPPNIVNLANLSNTTVSSIKADEQKRTKDVFNCPHSDRKHYAKNMCSNCYHKQGRAKRAWQCSHGKKAHYAKGLCQNCYLNQYHENKVMSTIEAQQKI